MDDLNQALSGLNSVLVLWIAGAAALVFVLVIIFDAIRRRRRRARMTAHSGQRLPPAKANPIKNLRTLFRSLDEELSSRRRNERERNRRE
jgi:hypothetical protein